MTKTELINLTKRDGPTGQWLQRQVNTLDRGQWVSWGPWDPPGSGPGGGPRSATSARTTFSRRRHREAAEPLGPRRKRTRGGRFACGWHRSNTRTAPCRMVVVARPGTAEITIGGEHGRRRRSESRREWARGHERARGRAGRAPGNTRSTMEGSDGGHGSGGHDGDGAGRR